MLLGTELLLALSDGGNGGRADLGDWNDLPLRSLNLLATALPSGGVLGEGGKHIIEWQAANSKGYMSNYR